MCISFDMHKNWWPIFVLIELNTSAQNLHLYGYTTDPNCSIVQRDAAQVPLKQWRNCFIEICSPSKNFATTTAQTEKDMIKYTNMMSNAYSL